MIELVFRHGKDVNSMNKNFSLHTFEISCNISCEDYYGWRDALFRYFKGRSYEPFSTGHILGLRFRGLSNLGINRIELVQCMGDKFAYRFDIRFVINPRRLLGEKAYPFTGIATQEHLERTPEIVDAFIQEIYPGFPSIFINGRITRIDYCTNINMMSEERAKHYLNLLRKGRYVRNMKPVKMYSKKKKITEFEDGRMKVKNGSCELEIYLKQEQMKYGSHSYRVDEIEEAAGYVRFEYRVDRIKIYNIREKYSTESEVDLLWRTAEIAEEEMTKLLERMYGTGDFYSQKEAEDRIDKCDRHTRTKHNMRCIVRSVHDAPNINEAFKWLMLPSDQANRYMKHFDHIGVSPITYGNKGSLYYNPLKYIKINNVNDGRRT